MKQPQGRVLPPKFKFVIEIPAMSKRLTMLQRLQLFVGYNFIVSGNVHCEHSPGKIRTEFRIRTTKEILPI